MRKRRKNRLQTGQGLLFAEGLTEITPKDQPLLPMDCAGFETSLEIGARFAMQNRIGKIVSVEVEIDGIYVNVEFGNKKERYPLTQFMASTKRA